MRIKERRRLKQECGRIGLPMVNMAVAMGIPPAYLSQIVTGRMNPTDQEMVKMSQYFGVPVEMLFPNEVAKRDK